MTNKAYIVAGVVMITLVACTDRERAAGSALAGVWRLVASETRVPDGRVFQGSPHESFLLFAGDQYSMNWAGGREPAVYSAARFNPTDEEKLARFSTLIVNAGRFEVAGNVLTIHPAFALVPEYVGGLGEFEYAVRGDTLDLVWQNIVSADGVPDPNTEAGVRYFYTWVRR